MNRLDGVFMEPKKLAAQSESGQPEVTAKGEPGENVTTASPGNGAAKNDAAQLVDLIGSAIG